MRVKNKKSKELTVRVQGVLRKGEMVECLADAMFVPPDVLREYNPPPILKTVVEEMLQGVMKHDKIAQNLGIPESEYYDIVRNPLNMAWVAQMLHKQVRHMLGLADVAIWRRACEGNVSAYKAMLERYGAMEPSKSLRFNVSGDAVDFNLDHLSETQLDRLIDERERATGRGHTEKPEGEGGPPQGVPAP